MDSYYGIFFLLIWLAIAIFLIASYWKVFTKAGKPGWASIIPIYNYYILLKIANRPGWWLLLIFFIPIVNLIILIIVSIDIAKVFGKGTVFGILGLFLFSFVGYPILGFGSAKYSGGESVGPVSAAPTVSAIPPNPVPANPSSNTQETTK